MTAPARQRGVDRVRAALEAAGIGVEIKTFPDSTRTAADAAAAIGCTVAQIAKSLVFRIDGTEEAVLIIASGPNRVNPHAVAARLAQADGHAVRLTRADAAFVRQATGFAIGGVAPVGHAQPCRVVIDADLARHETIWAAAGAPNAVFALTFDQLVALTGGIVAPIT